MIGDHDNVVLTEDLPEAGLEAGDIGTVVHVHTRGAGVGIRPRRLLEPMPSTSGR
jgi:hypothetical protein